MAPGTAVTWSELALPVWLAHDSCPFPHRQLCLPTWQMSNVFKQAFMNCRAGAMNGSDPEEKACWLDGRDLKTVCMKNKYFQAFLCTPVWLWPRVRLGCDVGWLGQEWCTQSRGFRSADGCFCPISICLGPGKVMTLLHRVLACVATHCGYVSYAGRKLPNCLIILLRCLGLKKFPFCSKVAWHFKLISLFPLSCPALS